MNETIRQIESIDGLDGWSVTTIGQIHSDIRIFKGPRLKSENLIVEDFADGVEPYYTPSAVLQEKSDSAKFLNINYASEKQLATINAVRVFRGDIVVTRSGTIGRVAFITQRLNGAIVSDDLIRIRIKDEGLRYYVYQFLQTEKALNQMLRNEYGAVQQHLEPNHVANILIPVPDDMTDLDNVITLAKEQIRLKEQLEAGNKELDIESSELLSRLINLGAEKNT